MSSGGVAVYARTFFYFWFTRVLSFRNSTQRVGNIYFGFNQFWTLRSQFDPTSSSAVSEIVIRFSTESSGLANKPKVKASLGARFISLGHHLALDLGLIILYCCISFLMPPNWQFLIFCCFFLVGLNESVDKYDLFRCYCSYLNWHVWINGCKW